MEQLLKQKPRLYNPTMIISILTILIIILCHLLPPKIRKKVLGNIRRCVSILRAKIKL